MSEQLTFLDLFAGIGGFRLGLEMAGHKCIGFCEIDKFARQTYKANFDTEGEVEWHDITQVTDADVRQLGRVDIITGGFPCQAFSVAGKRGGFDDTRGTLFFEIARIARILQPRYLLLENVKGLISHKTPVDFTTMVSLLNEEIQGGTLWEREFSPISNWSILSDNISHYLSQKLQMNLVFQRPKSDTSSETVLVLGYDKREVGVERGLMERLKYLKTQILQIMKKSNYCQIELMQLLGNSAADWVSNLNLLCSTSNLKTTDTSMLDEMVTIGGNIELSLRKCLEENSNEVKSCTTLTGSRLIIDQKICTYVQEANTLLFIIKQWKLSTNLWKRVTLNLTKKKGGMYYVGTFNIIINTLSELGFDCEWQLLNSKNFGVPQNRERVFIVGHLGGEPRRKVFPITDTSGQAIKQVGNIIDTESFGGNPQRGRVYSPDGLCPSLNTMQGGGLEPKIMMIDDSFSKQFGGTAVYEGYSPTLRASGASSLKVAIPVLTPEREEKRQNGRRFKEDGDPMLTITSQDRHGVAISHGKLVPREIAMTIDASYYKGFDNRGGRTGVFEKPSHIPGSKDINNTVRSGGRGSLTAKHNHDTIYDGVRIRRLTPLECFRLQGFPDSHHDNAKAAGVSDSQLYKQAGNAVTVNVVYEIAKNI